MIRLKRNLKRGMTGPDVLAIQRALRKAEIAGEPARTGFFGEFTEDAVRDFQRKWGQKVDGVYGDQTHVKAWPLFDARGRFLLTQAPEPKPDVSDVRQRIVDAAMFGYRNRDKIGYTQSSARMYGVRNKIRPPRIPIWEDCSSFATWCMWVAEIPMGDPNGYDYDGRGYTGTLCLHGVPVAVPLPGDLGFYGYGAPYTHVVIYVGGGLCVSHGSNPGPSYRGIHYRTDLRVWRRYVS